MNGLQALDVSLFHFVNSSLSNPLFDRLMPWFSGNPFYVPLLVLILAGLVWKGGPRGRLCALCVVLAVALGDGVLCKFLKQAVGRPRPFLQLHDVRLLLGRGLSGSMPSSHAANSFAVLTAFFLYYRRSLLLILPLALVISFSRVYNGVHFPSDVLAGALLGAGYTFGGIWTLDKIWRALGRKYFPLWHARLPSLLRFDSTMPETGKPPLENEPFIPPILPILPIPPEAGKPLLEDATSLLLDRHWFRLGCLATGLLLAVQLGYLAADKVDLSEDEAYQWVWSKHPALSYYSKPPLIALTQWLGTRLWGDTEFGVRFFSPVIAALISLMVLRFFAAQHRARTGFWVTIALTATPALAAGSILMTVDPLLVLFWTGGMIAGWRATRAGGTTGDWLWAGLGIGLGFLSKYTALFQLVSWGFVFALLPRTRAHLRRPGPYLALLAAGLAALPVLVWNARHGWITVAHVAHDGKIGEPWHFTLEYLSGFLVKETVLLNPFFALIFILAVLGWRRRERSELETYIFWMGFPVFFFYLLFTLHSAVLPNWIAPAVVPFFCFAGLRWDALHAAWPRLSGALLGAGTAAGLLAAVTLHDTGLLQKAFQRALPSRVDPLKRVEGWREFGRALASKRAGLADPGGGVFLIGDHYGITGLMSFYVPEAKSSVAAEPLAYYLDTGRPDNQFYFWPSYLDQRPGQNAIFVQSLENPGLVAGWFWKWIREGDQPGLERPLDNQAPALPAALLRQFRRVEDLGPLTVFYERRALHYFRLYYCVDARRPGKK
jgi:4-amino-4-deoxy-L-arabinose transferase-like glycosyltransferase/membrane-associated phospholipid phosphatase